MKTITKLSMIAILAAATLVSCKKDDDNITPSGNDGHSNAHGEVALHMHYMINGEDLTLGETYDLNGLSVAFSRIQFYMHDITFYADHMMTDSVRLNDLYWLAGAEDTHFDVGDIEMGHIHMMKFKLGVDPINNAQTEDEFLARPSDDPLAAQTPSMHWNWNPGSGYKFAVFEGTYNAGANNFVYHCATDAMLRTTDAISVHMDVDHDNTNQVHLMLNLNQVFDGIDIETASTAHGAQPTNTMLMDHLATSFSVME